MSFNTTRETITVFQKPDASFTINPASGWQWGDTIDLNDTSTGVITTWEWDFENDGTVDSTSQNPTGILLSNLGSQTINLTVTGPGGTSTAQQTIWVDQRPITCDFNIITPISPGTTDNYNSIVTDLLGRTATYTWNVNGPGTNVTYTSQNITHTFNTDGNYQISLSVDAFDPGTGDTQTCVTVVKTVQVEYPTLTCSFTGDLTPNPDGSTYTYTSTVGNVAGRTLNYQWYVDGVPGPITQDYTSPPLSAKGFFDLRLVVTPVEGGTDCDTGTTNHQYRVAYRDLLHLR